MARPTRTISNPAVVVEAEPVQVSTGDLRAFLTWARSNGFRIDKLEMAGVKLELADLRVEGARETPAKGPRDVHEAFAKEFGLDIPPDEDDETEEQRS
jgi:hypothetical protein